MWQAIELREIRVFLVLADELHFRRTAERVGLTQSRVSQTIRALERKLGLELAHRTSRRVTLTPSGERFREDVAAALGGLDEVLRSAQAASGQLTEPVRLGVTNAAAIGPRLRAIITAFEDAHPGGSVQVVGLPFRDRFGPLRREEVDLMVTGLPLAQPDLATSPVLVREPRLLAVGRDHPLADRESVSVEELADHRVAELDVGMPPELLEELVPSTTPTGRPIPRSPAPIRETSELILAIVHSGVVQPVTSMFAENQRHPDVVFVPLRDMPPSETVLAWRRHHRSRGLQEFLRTTHAELSAGTQP